VGETDASGMFTLVEFECLGACDRAPVVMVNNEHWHENATAESCSKLVDDLRQKGISALSGCHLHVERS
jgi:NADH-quinone oxidoreductase subunit E